MRYLTLVALLLGTIGCRGQSTTKNAAATSVTVGHHAATPQSQPYTQAAGTSPAPRTCPAAMPVLCPDGCCPAGATCKLGGGCASAAAAPTCPADAPVACSASVACGPSGCIARDATPHYNDFLLRTPTGWAAGRFGTGVSTYQSGCATAVAMTATANGLPSGNAAETIELWFTVPATAPVGLTGILTQGDRRIDMYGAGTLELSAGLHGQVATDVWHFAAVTWDPATSRLHAWVDGTSWGTDTIAGGFSTQTAAGLILGQDVSGACGMFPGTIDELRIESVVLDDSQLALDYASAELRIDASTVGLWHFDEGDAHRCCPAGDTCDASIGCVAPPIGAGCQVACADGSCCPVGAVCVPIKGGTACAAPGSTPVCPPSAPVVCSDGTCCPSGDVCTKGHCEHDVAAGETPACPSGDIAVPTGPGTVDCCPPMAGNTITIVGGKCTYSVCYPIGGGGVVCSACDASWCPYTCQSDNVSCAATPDGAPQTCASGVACGPIGCCPSGATCNAGNGCCAAGEYSCGDGCCPNGTVCTAAGNCVANPVPSTCSISCPAGSTCQYGSCVTGTVTQPQCASGIACGQKCCASDDACIAGACAVATVGALCPDGLPGTACGCCPFGSSCIAGECVDDEVPYAGPTGAACAGEFCPGGASCTGDALCCPQDSGAACGSTCCGLAEDCVGGVCTCSGAFPQRCGSECCLADEICVGGHCDVACDKAGTPPCGDECCNEGFKCNAGACCPGDHPVKCGDVCCLAGASCLATGDCGCPGTRVACGGVCCDDGEVCDAGECGPPCDTSKLTELLGSSSGTFTYAACAGGATSPDDATLTIYVTNGHLVVTNSYGASFVGSLSGESVTFGVSTGEGTITFTGTIDGACKMSGTWTESSPADAYNCSQRLAGTGSGTWSASSH